MDGSSGYFLASDSSDRLEKHSTKRGLIMGRPRSEKPAGFPMTEELKNEADQAKAPADIQITASEESVKAPEAKASEEIQTDVRAKLAKKSVDENVFVPTTPAALEKAAEAVAQEKGFDLTRGTSIGARLIARAQKRV
jgi:hypothetical protein